ncbi:hypothetical protein BFP97_01755 [Roseivirga sp. 4D4]|uniref:ABC transporter substrate-binding protein n=1 Tax=Roseivirga sp. 4D4 TaxID=1889784 RepID=UPI000853578A|nr:ABC transporter substrate-binding protein [Roseivirga sp. 4D4]OEK00314.1 hypothetical protein BFP97_01755 [Roseivirga sp. 4D4]
MKEVSVGVLLPSSSIYPIGKQFEKGIKSELADLEGIEVEFIPEFIGQGEVKQLENAIEKLKSYHSVDIITGWVSNKGLMEVSEKVKGNTPYYINNLGEHTPDPAKIPNNVRLNSIHLWQQLWSLGYWAVKDLGKKGMIVGALYDMGYSFNMMLDQGMLAADKESQWSFAVCPMPEQGQLSDPGKVLDHVEREQPEFLFAAFCGEESTLFLDEFIKRGLHKTIPLLGTPYLLESFSQKVDEPLKIYTTHLSSLELSESDMDQEWIKPYDVFHQLGRETGLCIKSQLNGSKSVSDKRGLLNMSVESLGEGNRVYIIENSYSGDKESIERKLLKEVKTTTIQDKDLQQALTLKSAAWLNPYLGI